MRITLISLAVLFLSACEPEITSTFVDGTVGSVSMPNANAVFVADKDVLGGARRTVWLGSGLQCSQLHPGAGFDINLGATERGLPDGGRLPTLILTSNGIAQLDTGVGDQRVAGTMSHYREVSTSSPTQLKGRFTADFDGGSFTGDFVAGPCEGVSAGCSTGGGVSVVVLAALTVIALRRRRSGLFGAQPQ
ncbi:MAG: MYXO-CTERM sorting domain-containing protein [Myxococcaceae bacterium]